MHANKLFATVPFALLLAVTPAHAQISTGVHIDIPVIGHGGDYRRAPVREVRVYEYPPVPYGQWKKHYRNWNREAIYSYQDRYYDYPIRGGRAMYVYRDHDRYFWGPGDGRWDNWDRWDGGRNVQYDRNDRDDRDDRYDRDDRNDRYNRNDRDDRYDRNRDGRDDRYRVQSYPAPGRDVYRGPMGNNNGHDNRATGDNDDRDGRSAGNGNGRDNRPAARSDQGNGRGGNNGKGRGNGRARG